MHSQAWPPSSSVPFVAAARNARTPRAWAGVALFGGGLLAGFGCVHAAVTIGAGSSVDFGNAVVDFGCQDLAVAGQVGGSTETLRSIADLSISAGGTLAPGAGDVSLGGDFVDAGSFVPGTSRFAIVDTCGHGTSQVSGATSFHDFLVVTSSAKQLVLPSAATQSVAHALGFHGTAGNLLHIASSSAGVHALLAVSPAVVQTIDYVDVSDNTASIATIAPGAPAQYHSVDAGGLVNWFGGSVGGGGGATIAPAPLLDTLGSVALLLGCLFIACTNRPSRRSGSGSRRPLCVLARRLSLIRKA